MPQTSCHLSQPSSSLCQTHQTFISSPSFSFSSLFTRVADILRSANVLEGKKWLGLINSLKKNPRLINMYSWSNCTTGLLEIKCVSNSPAICSRTNTDRETYSYHSRSVDRLIMKHVPSESQEVHFILCSIINMPLPFLNLICENGASIYICFVRIRFK